MKLNMRGGWGLIGEVLVLLLIAALIWLPRSRGLGRYVTPDEPRWLYRSANFYIALCQRDFAAAYQKEHPGVTVMWAGALAFHQAFPEYRSCGTGQLDLHSYHRFLKAKSAKDALSLLTAARQVMVLMNTLALAAAFWYARRLAGLLAVAVGFILLAFDPFHLALTTLLHLDGLLANLMLLSLLAFQLYRRERNWLHLGVSAAAAGAAWLTKTPAVALIPMAGLLSLPDLWQGGAWYQRLARYLKPLLLWGLGTALVCWLFWPALWVNAPEVLANVFGEAQKYVSEGHSSNVFFDGRVYSAGEMGARTWHFYPFTYMWRSTPLGLLGLALAAIAWARKRPPFHQQLARLLGEAALVFSILFTLLLSLSEKRFDRYLIPVYPWLDLLAGLGWAAAARWGAGWLRGFCRRFGRPAWLSRPARYYGTAGVWLALMLLGQALLIAPIFPYTHAYYNPLLGGAPAALADMQMGWGEGLDLAAAYLNSLPEANDLRVLSWYNLGSFSYFFRGHNEDIFEALSDNPDWERRLAQYDYAVVYVHQVQRGIMPEVVARLAQSEPVFTATINGAEYAWVYRINP